MKKVSYVVWDWNGTLFDDVDVCVSIINNMLYDRQFGKEYTIEKYKEIFCFPIVEYYKNAGLNFDEESFEDLAQIWMDKYSTSSKSCGIHKGVISVLDNISQNGIKQIILSASQKENLIEQVNQFNIINYFDNLLGLDNIYAKSKVDIGQQWAIDNNIDCNEVILIGDTIHDYEVASKLNFECILIQNGHQSKKVLEKCGCPVVEDITGVMEYIL